ncbi:ABC transporter substrate-binding protein [Arcobacter aquimarinus]|uniref:Extracellular ligand-binding protein n=1 Tax=Arcobacter aquimarinus TaxID=1315211 RepID=A0AAE7E1C1_9BACT|nr:ABC transporter substrate-binding protein [Arcobacter aquimarinus]QKE26455.1 putative extracellular ligand-binding protein [Arcobacter aquimarinus]RXI33410.1 amino acid-binding protein [Arcobacter aquimarinus]
MSKKLFIFTSIFILFYLFIKDDVFEDKTISIGTSIPNTGIIKSWGEAVYSGANAYFSYTNENNIIKNKKINFLVYDDKYEPELTYENTQKLIYKDKVFALFGFVGTPTVKRVLPILYDENIPFFSSFTGASFLRDEKNKNFINFRSSYEQEIETLINYLNSIKKLNKIAVFYQNDDYGEEGYISLINSLKQKNLKLIAEGSYKRNTLSINHAFNEIEDAKPEVIFMIGAYKTNSLFIKKAKENENLKDAIFCTISFGDANSIVKELENLNSNTKNIIFSQVVPSYTNKNLPVVIEYQELMKKYYPNNELGFLSFEAFLSSKILVNAISRIKGEITRSKFLYMLKTTPTNLLEGIPLAYNQTQLLNKTYLFEYKNNEFIEIEK